MSMSNTIIEIKRRDDGRVIFSVALGPDMKSCAPGVQLGFAVKKAIQAGYQMNEVDLRGVDLSGATLNDTPFIGSDLRGANFSNTVLNNVDFCSANLDKSDFSNATLDDVHFLSANLTDTNLDWASAKGVSMSICSMKGAYLGNIADSKALAIPDLDAKILAALENGGTLDMHGSSTSEAAHSRAGWAVAMAGEAGKALAEKIGTEAAGAFIYAASYPEFDTPLFFEKKGTAMEDIRYRAGYNDSAPEMC